MYTIHVLDANMKTIERTDLEHNFKNVYSLAKKYETSLGKIKDMDWSSDCITIVTYEKGILGFSI